MVSGIPDHIHVGRDGWLLLKTGSNDVIGQLRRPEETAELVWRWRSLVATPGRRGLSGLYGDRRRSRRWRETCVDLVGPMRAARDAAELYCRTDTHGTFAGCHLAHAGICKACGAQARPDLADRPFRANDHDGDLGSAFTPPRRAPSRTYAVQRDAVRTYAGPIVALRERAGLLHTLHVGAHVVYENAASSDPRRVLLFGDSFSRVLPYMLTILLAETFREPHVV